MRQAVIHWNLLCAVLLASTTRAAAPPVGPVTVQRVGSDLAMTWEPPATPVDGYRVIRSNDPACMSNVPIYNGIATSFNVVGAFTVPTPAMYRVTSLVGSEESEPSPPAYVFGVELRSLPDTVINFVSIPYVTPIPHQQALCDDINQGTASREPVYHVHGMSDWWELRITNCGTGPLPGLPLRPGEAKFLTPSPMGVGSYAYIWGQAPATGWTVTLTDPFAFVPSSMQVFGYGHYTVSLPYDHAYPDLLAVAAEIPSAVMLRVNDVEWCPIRPCPLAGTGLLRPSAGSPWSGTNVNLELHRGEGLMVGVQQATQWTIRRQCTGPAVFGGDVDTLLAVSRGNDIELSWNLGASPGAIRYDIYRVDSLAALADLAAQPVYRTVGSAPTLPVVDGGAVLLPGPLYYAVKVY